MFFGSQTDRVFSRKLLSGASLGALALVMAGTANAQTVAPAPVEAVTVTGTMIQGINPIGSNLVTIDTSTIKAVGAMTTNDILAQIPQISNTFNTTAVAQTQINIGSVRPVIRYIPSQAIVGGSETLVLMNGENMVGVSGLATAPDPGMIPTIVLDQVAVMPDGASSVYGANAITGVINFVTKRDFEGFQANSSVGLADGYSSFIGSAIAGMGWNSGGAYLAYEHKNNSRLAAVDRAYTNQDLVSIGGRDSRSTNCALPNIKIGSTYYAMTGYPSGAPGSLAANTVGPFGPLDSVTNAGSLNRCDTNAQVDLVPKQEQDSVFGSVHQHIMPGVDFSATVMWSSRLATQHQGALTATQTIDDTNPFFQSIAGETSQSVLFSFSPYLGKDYTVGRNLIQMFQFTPKLTIDLPFDDWQLNLTGNYGRSFSNGRTPGVDSSALSVAMRQQTINGVLSPNLVGASSSSGNAVDPYNLSMGNPQVLNAILGGGNIGKADQHVLQYEAMANGTLFSLPGGDVKAAIGYKYSWDDYIAKWFISAPFGQDGGLPNPGSQTAFAKVHRITNAFFGEVVVPLVGPDNAMPFVKDLSLDISGRADEYSDFGRTNNYKLGFTWNPFDMLTVRGTKGTSYDAPSLADTSAPDGRYIYQDHSTSPNTTVPPGTSAADALRPSIFVPGGNPNLGPELGNTWSLGVDIHPSNEFGIDLTGLDISVTRWHIFIEHQIGLTPFNSPLLFQIPQYARFYQINPTEAELASKFGYSSFIGFPGPGLGSIYPPNVPASNTPYIAVSARRNNIGNALLEGYDFAAKYTTDVNNFGTISLGFSGTVSTEDSTQAVAGTPWNNIQANGAPLYQATAFAQLTTGPWSGRVWVNYSPSFKVNPGLISYTLYNQQRIPAFHPVNLYMSYALDELADWGDGASVGLTINNIGDDAPPIYLEGGSAITTNGGRQITGSGSSLGRYFVLNVTKKF
jgi:iron complex outermembrane receptor protein